MEVDGAPAEPGPSQTLYVNNLYERARKDGAPVSGYSSLHACNPNPPAGSRRLPAG
jgi:hypothetical protein